MANETLYLKIEQNIQVHSPQVTLGDIASMECKNRELLNKLKTLKIKNATSGEPGRHAMSVMEIISEIQKEYPNLEINNIGESDFIVTMEKACQPGEMIVWGKTIFVSILTFFGAAFTIMTFNNDVNIPKLFGQLFFAFTGEKSNGFTVLEITYSIGVGLGILVYFNHFMGRKLTADPTPMEVQMRIYEDDVNTTLMESSNRKPGKEQKKREYEKGRKIR